MAAARSDEPKKVMDVMTPGQVKPGSSSRPLVVGNRPVLGSDPMMVADAAAAGPTMPTAASNEEDHTSTETGAAIVSHQAKIVVPLESASESAKGEEEKPEAAAAPADEPASGEDESKDKEEKTAPAKTEEPAKEATPKTDEDEAPADDTSVEKDETDTEAAEVANENSKAAQKIASEADAKRRLELDDLIASGKYALPINAVRRKRSRTVLITLLVVLLLAVVVLDGLLDAGVLHLSGVPHTDFLKS